jgi:gliding motility-associated protein GldL
MGKYVKYRNRIEKFLQTERGKRFLNYTYSFGAAIVIFGAMAKLLYLPFGNVLLAIGMITEICVFVLSAFDTPVKDYRWEEVFPVLATDNPDDRPDFSSGTGIAAKSAISSAVTNLGSNPKEKVSREASVFHSSSPEGGDSTRQKSAQASVHDPVLSSSAADSLEVNDNIVGSLDAVAENVQKFAHAVETLTRISESLQDSYRYIIDHSQEISQNSLGYVQQMEALNRNISGLNTIYEIQLRSISGQIETIDQINAGLLRLKTMYNDSVPDGSVIRHETEKLADQLRELNRIYTRMIESMTAGSDRHNP